MRASQAGIAFIKAREGYRSQAYKLANDVYTLGYGLTYIPRLGRRVRAGDTTNVSQAESDLKDFIETQVRTGLNKALGNIKITQSGYDALTSYCFNRSVGLFKGTGLYQLVIKNPLDSRIREQFKIDWGTNQTYKDSLIVRRGLEANLYFTDTKPVANNTTNIITGLVLLLVVLLIFNHKKVYNYVRNLSTRYASE